MTFRVAFLFLALSLSLIDCSSVLGQTASTTMSDIVTGQLSFDAKPAILKHIYAHRMKRSNSGGDREILALVLTTKALSAADLQNLLNRYSLSLMEQELLADKMVTGLFFLIVKNNLRLPIYIENFISTGRVYRNGGRPFLEFDLSKGRMRGKAVDATTENGADGTDATGGARFNYRYTVKFEATLRGEALYQVLDGAAAPGELTTNLKQGTAEGTLTVNGSQINLKYAYAARKRLFFDEPEESMPVLITDRPVSKEDLLRTFRDKELIAPGFQGILVTFTNQKISFLSMFIFHQSLESGVFATATGAEEVTITKENISAKVVGEDKTTRDRWTYSVKFSASFNK